MKLKSLGIISIAAVLAACASQPQQPASDASTATPAPSAASLVKPAAAPAAVPAAKADAPEVNRTLISAGYKPTTIKGEVYYCRTVDVTNTAFKKKVCLNEDQIKDEERKIKDMQQEMMRQRSNPSCMGPGCGG